VIFTQETYFLIKAEISNWVALLHGHLSYLIIVGQSWIKTTAILRRKISSG